MPTLSTLALLASTASSAYGYGWVASQPGVDSSMLGARRYATQKRAAAEKRETGVEYAPGTCPFNAEHPGAAPYTEKYPYTGAKDGKPGSQKGGILVPAEGDTAHYFTEPGPGDIRGPCPGLNTAANHNFLSHDGITNFNELVDAQQNLYNVGYDLASLLAVLGIQADGDIFTTKLSIGCDATSRTATVPLLGNQPGLNGHNKFEGDTSLTRNDYFTHNGDNYSFNGTLFAKMKGYADSGSAGNFDFKAMADYRSQRYEESKVENANFFFGPLSLLLFGAASFVYELFPSFGDKGVPDLENTKSFFGAVEDPNALGGWRHVAERIPPNWFSRVEPYTNQKVTEQILAMYLAHPKLFGGNVGTNNFDALNTFGLIADGKIPDDATASDFLCLLYQLATMAVPSSVSGLTDVTAAALDWSAGKLNPLFKNAGCALRPDQTFGPGAGGPDTAPPK